MPVQSLEGDPQPGPIRQLGVELLEREARPVFGGAAADLADRADRPRSGSGERLAQLRSVSGRGASSRLLGLRLRCRRAASSSRGSTLLASRCSSARARAASDRAARGPPPPRLSPPPPRPRWRRRAGLRRSGRNSPKPVSWATTGPAAGQIAGAAIAEPAAARGDVAALGDRRARPSSRGRTRRSGRGRRRPERGRAGPSRSRASASRSARLVGVDAEGKLEAGAAASRQVDQLAQRVGALAVVDAAVLDRAVAAPVADAGEGVVAGAAGSTGQWSRATGGRVGIQLAAAGRDRAAVAADRPPPTVTKWVCRSRPMSCPSRCQTWLKPGSRSRKSADRDRLQQPLVAQHAGDVEQQVGFGGEAVELRVGQAERLASPPAPAGPRAPRAAAASRSSERDRGRRRRRASPASSGSTSTTSCPSRRSPATYCRTAQVAPPWWGSPATMPLSRILRRSASPSAPSPAARGGAPRTRSESRCALGEARGPPRRAPSDRRRSARRPPRPRPGRRR